ncbi:MAG: DNA adenine methylase, partial [Candidatus Regiella insecticola]|nr:DNA adenine methylase [Candidatus Regiella insecticola]
GAVIYCDPPYAPLSVTANFTSYHSKSFTTADQKNLAHLAYQLFNQNKIPVLISNHDTELTRAWYYQATLHQVKASRTISSNILGRHKVNELLALYS